MSISLLANYTLILGLMRNICAKFRYPQPTNLSDSTIITQQQFILKVETALNFISSKNADDSGIFNLTNKIRKHEEEVIQVQNDYQTTLDLTFD